MAKVKDIKCLQFGRLIALERAGSTDRGLAVWKCRYTCGNEVVVQGNNLRTGHTRSCGCFMMESARENGREYSTTHGMSGSPEYRAWNHMLQRCTNPNANSYSCYGGRGITVTPTWSSFEAFYRDMGPKPSKRHSLDRIDTNGPYEPGNCRWATPREQANNRRGNIKLTVLGAEDTVANTAREHGINPNLLHHDYARHGREFVEDTFMDALLLPVWADPRTRDLLDHSKGVCLSVFRRPETCMG